MARMLELGSAPNGDTGRQALRLEVTLRVLTSCRAGKGSPPLATGQYSQSSVLRKKSKDVSLSFYILCKILQAIIRCGKSMPSVSLSEPSHI